ncbi:RNA binding protein-like [Oryza sativa Japonica Group]|uniref:RNA binding protein-like n=1 Tax=Oryza sativa subsp. japonica TaxID=39947 RepID=Q5JKB2_ORYSJ|nr:RNA binding protein-like [Oryza sativa Japonica Group]
MLNRLPEPGGRGARTGFTGVGPTRQPHGPRWTGCTPGSHRPAPWAPRVSRTRGRGRLTARPHAAAARRARRRPRRRGRREAALAPLWSPTAAIGTAERRPREGKGSGKGGGGPRLTPGRRRQRKRWPERRKAAARLE